MFKIFHKVAAITHVHSNSHLCLFIFNKNYNCDEILTFKDEMHTRIRSLGQIRKITVAELEDTRCGIVKDQDYGGKQGSAIIFRIWVLGFIYTKYGIWDPRMPTPGKCFLRRAIFPDTEENDDGTFSGKSEIQIPESLDSVETKMASKDWLLAKNIID